MYVHMRTSSRNNAKVCLCVCWSINHRDHSNEPNDRRTGFYMSITNMSDIGICHHLNLVGGWAYPSEKIWKSVGIILPNIWKKQFQTTHQINKANMGSFHVHVSGWEMLWGAAGMDTQYYIIFIFIMANLRYPAKNRILSWWTWKIPLIPKD